MRNTPFRASPIKAAGLAGAMALALLAFDTDRAAAQEPPAVQVDVSNVPDPNPDELKERPEEQPAEEDNPTSRIDLSGVSFQASVVRPVGSAALIVTRKDNDYLLPLEVVTSPDGEALNPEYLTSGQAVVIRLVTRDARMVALENNVMTVRDRQNILQFPADEMSEEVTGKVVFAASVNGKRSALTLRDAVKGGLELTMAQTYSPQLPAEAEVGVLVATQPERLILATAGDGGMSLVEIPQTMMAGESVLLNRGADGRILVRPLGELDESEKSGPDFTGPPSLQR